MSPARLEILTDTLGIVARLIMEARSDRDAEALRNQLRALGPAARSDVDAVEAEALRRLRQDEPTQSTRVPLAPDFPSPVGGDLQGATNASQVRATASEHGDLIGGPLDGGD